MLTEHNWFDHTGPDGSTLVQRVERAGFPFNVQVGEVLAWGTESWPAEDVVDAWLNSAAHREEILSGDYTPRRHRLLLHGRRTARRCAA